MDEKTFVEFEALRAENRLLRRLLDDERLESQRLAALVARLRERQEGARAPWLRGKR